jgi:Zn-dependent protease with chaperone function
MLHVSRRIVAAWTRQERALDEGRWGIRAFAIDADFPVVAVAGVIRPKLYVDRRVLDACLPGELDAIAAHERAHVRHRDNWRRLLIGACAGPTSLEAAAWREAAERAADTRAADSPRQALNLASALLKMARLAPSRTFERTALSTIHDGGSLETRVAYLLRTVAPAPPVHHTPIAVVMLLVPSALVLGLNWSTLLRSVHVLTEAAVRHLP